jgi:hypothetical protein
MNERPVVALANLDDDGLALALRGLAGAVDWPAAAAAGSPDLADRVRTRLDDRGARRPASRWSTGPGRWRLALVLALVALLALAAVAGALGLGLPGLRLILGGSGATPPPTVAPSATAPAGAPGARLGLGRALSLEDARALTGRVLRTPTDPVVGPPDAVYVDATRRNQVSMVWSARPDLPTTQEPGVGLILMTFDGTLDGGYFTKLIRVGVVVAPLEVGDVDGYWIEGEPHMFFYETRNGPVDDQRRWVGDALIWTEGETTYRLETSLGQGAALRIAASLE